MASVGAVHPADTGLQPPSQVASAAAPAVTVRRRQLEPGRTPKALGPFFALASWAPGLIERVGRLVLPVIPVFLPQVRRSTRLNAHRIFGRKLTISEQKLFTRNVVRSFFLMVIDMARAARIADNSTLADRLVSQTHGEPEYAAIRRSGRGAVLVSAHFGSFEAGLAALRRVEPLVHVVFKRDQSAYFERLRARLRRSLGVREAPIDDGLSTWLSLRDALLRGEVVVLHGDRAVPGQRSTPVPFLNGTLLIPTGPVKLARLTGCPIVPVFAIRREDGHHDIYLAPPIEPGDASSVGPDHAVVALAKAIESVVREHPHQWLVLDAAFEEDHRE